MRLKLLVFLILILAGIAAFTNPSLETHKEKVMSKIFEINQKTISSKISYLDNVSIDAENSAGVKLAKEVLQNTVGNLITREDHILYSTTNVSFKGIKYKIGVGFFGYVFLSDEFEKNVNMIESLSSLF